MAFEEQRVGEFSIHNDTKVMFLYKENGQYRTNQYSFAVSLSNDEVVCQYISSLWFNQLYNPSAEEMIDFMVVGVAADTTIEEVNHYVDEKDFDKFRFHYNFSVSTDRLRDVSDTIRRQGLASGTTLDLISNENDTISLTFITRVIENAVECENYMNEDTHRVLLSNPKFVIPKGDF